MGKTPYYVFDADALAERVRLARAAMPRLPLTFSVKANPFLTGCAAACADHVEVCSPGELSICVREGVPGEKIIYSGVVKGPEDLRQAVALGAAWITAESPRQAEMVQRAAKELGKRVRGMLRLSSGNQFGMDEADLREILAHPERFPDVDWTGLHYYSGTQKKKTDPVLRDLEHLRRVLDALREELGFLPALVEYGPGLAADYFGAAPEETDQALLASAAGAIREFPYPLGIEMGRFLAAPCGTYHTRVADVKTTGGVRYVLLDGGIHHLKYYGQMMAMHIPPLRQETPREGEKAPYCLCGSLCTAADVLARDALLSPPEIGDELVFERCGAYSVTEASALFLSRDLPEIYLQKDGKRRLLRGAGPSWPMNTGGAE